MRLGIFVLANAALLLAAKPAAASGCFLGPFATLADIPVGCPVTAWQQQGQGAPRVSVKRDGQLVELTPTIETETVLLRVDFLQTDCDGIDHRTQQDHPYDRSRITLDGSVAGDEIYVEGLRVGLLVASGACPAEVTPTPSCSGFEEGCSGDDPPLRIDGDGGCSTGGGAGLALGLLALALRRRR